MHTPGPWHMDVKLGRTEGFIYIENEDDTGRNICDICPSSRVKHADKRRTDSFVFNETDLANARLIANAPGLLHALRQMLREHDALQMAENRTDDRWPAATLARTLINRLEP
jgi:hypothetical protein